MDFKEIAVVLVLMVLTSLKDYALVRDLFKLKIIIPFIQIAQSNVVHAQIHKLALHAIMAMC